MTNKRNSVSDPNHLGQPDPDPFHKTSGRIRILFIKRIRVAKKLVKIMEIFHKNQPNSREYHTVFFFFKKLNFSLTDIKIKDLLFTS